MGEGPYVDEKVVWRVEKKAKKALKACNARTRCFYGKIMIYCKNLDKRDKEQKEVILCLKQQK